MSIATLLPILLSAPGEHAHVVPMSTTLIFTGVLVAMVLSLAFEEKIHAKKSMITGTFAVISLLLGAAFGLLPFGPITNAFGESLGVPVYIPAIDWEVIAIIMGSSLFVDATSKSGLFTYIAIKLTKASKGDPFKLLVYYGLMTVFFSAVLNNVTAMIIVGSLTAVSLAKLEQRDKLLGFLLIEGLLTNIGGLLTLISSVPNIIVGGTAGISFVEFFLVASPYVAVATALTIGMGTWRFGIRGLESDEERERAARLVSGFDELDGIESMGFFRFSAGILAAFILVMATTSVLPFVSELGMGYVAMSFGLIALVKFKAKIDEFLRAIDWDLLFFFGFLFIVINVMEHAKVLELIGHGLDVLIGLGKGLGTSSLLVASAVFSSVTDNIPLAAMLAKALANLETPADSPLWWSVVFGANLGGNITPIGSASTVVAFTIMNKQGLEVSFLGFVKLAGLFAVVQIILAVAYVLGYAYLFA